MKVSKNHKMRPINIVFLKVDEYNIDLKCSKHYNEPLSLFCKRCEISCCTICAISAHCDCKSKGKGKENKHDLSSWSDLPTWQFTGSTKTKDLFPGFGLQKSESKIKAEKEEMKKKEDRELFFDYDKKLKESKKKEEKRHYPVTVSKLRMDHRKTRIGFGSASKDDWVISMAMLTSG
ncbi:MAG: B-box zinc finger protein, partial [Candidatus Thiodiazotropha sp.]